MPPVAADGSALPRILIYLVRRDLRLADNPILHAISTSNPSTRSFTHLLPLYVFSAPQIETSGFHSSNSTAPWPFPPARSRVGNFIRCGPHRARFLAESVWSMKQSLEYVGSDLFIRAGYIDGVVEGIVRSWGDKAKFAGLWMTAEVTTEEVAEQEAIRKVVEKYGGETKLWKDEKYFVDDDDLEFDFNKMQDLPDVFTTFRKSLEPLRDRPRSPLPAADKLPPLPPTSLFPPVEDYMTVPNTKAGLINAILKPLPKNMGFNTVPFWPEGEDVKEISAHPFGGGEETAHDRLKHLITSGSMKSYKDTRNGLNGLDFSTKLSAFLAIGCITARQVHAAMVLLEDGEKAQVKTKQDRKWLEAFKGSPGFGEGENEGTTAVRFELLWRDYMRLCARKFGSKLFLIDGFRGKSDKQWKYVDKSSPPDIKQKFQRFLSGRTGIGLIDASQRELYLTGYSSNRARQNVASFLSKTLHLDWRLGAEWYESMLVDYDASSNWGNWQYVSGVGNDPREGRVFNPIKQALDYDAKGEYIKRWIPEVRDLDINGPEGSPDQERLMGLYQAWRIDPATKKALNIDELDWVKSPLIEIPFSVGRKPRSNNNRGRGGFRGRGMSRGWGRGNHLRAGG